MTELVLLMGISLDGFVARHGRYAAGGWGGPAEDPELKARKLEWLGSAGFHLMGRNMAPRQRQPAVGIRGADEQHPQACLLAGTAARGLAGLAYSGRRELRGDRATEARVGRRRPDRLGGAAFAWSLARQGLVDEYRLVRQPVAVGDALPLFSELAVPVAFRLTESVSYASGELLTIYRQESPPRG